MKKAQKTQLILGSLWKEGLLVITFVRLKISFDAFLVN